MTQSAASPHPDSLVRLVDGRAVELKAHRCHWSGDFPENSLPAIAECYRDGVARVEIDLRMLSDADYLVFHDPTLEALTDGAGPVHALTRRDAAAPRLRHGERLTTERPPLFSEVVELIRADAGPTLMELDLPETEPIPWPRVEELARLAEPVKTRIVFGSEADWNLRRLLLVDPTLPMSFNPMAYLDWRPEESRHETDGLPLGAYGYLDAHPLARVRHSPVADYLRDRLGGIMRLVPGARDAHLRLRAFERMLDDGVDVAAIFHELRVRLDVWTLNAGPPRWQARLFRALDAGVNIVTTDTPRRLAEAIRGRAAEGDARPVDSPV